VLPEFRHMKTSIGIYQVDEKLADRLLLLFLDAGGGGVHGMDMQSIYFTDLPRRQQAKSHTKSINT
jgi:hypothetical protein